MRNLELLLLLCQKNVIRQNGKQQKKKKRLEKFTNIKTALKMSADNNIQEIKMRTLLGSQPPISEDLPALVSILAPNPQINYFSEGRRKENKSL